MTSLRVSAVLASLLVACAGDDTPNHGGPPAPGDGDDDPTFQPDSGGHSVPGDDGGVIPDTFVVTLGSDQVEVCPGACATLRPMVSGSTAELKYTWSHDLAGDGEVEVCPEETTTYELSVQEQPDPDNEFASERTASDRLTISVKNCDPESPVLCEARFRFDYPVDGNVLEVDKPWISAAGYDSTLHASKDDSVFVVAAFGNTVDLGAGAVTAGSAANGLVHKRTC
jgi:hypothetical protein